MLVSTFGTSFSDVIFPMTFTLPMVFGGFGSIGTSSTAASRGTRLSKFNAGAKKSNCWVTQGPSSDEVTFPVAKAVSMVGGIKIDTANIVLARRRHIFLLFICGA
ncbi:hypothetical protein D3C71_1553250 [compost metagenome]